jgi:Protein of unknown function (DUF3579)
MTDSPMTDASRMLRNDLPSRAAVAVQHNIRLDPAAPVTTPPKPREIFIQGVTPDGRTFRPSDWAERLAGAMSCFRPGGGVGGLAGAIGYSPYCVPTLLGNVKCVVVNEALRDLEPMAWDFVMNFARDNHLQVSEACLLPDPPPPPSRR